MITATGDIAVASLNPARTFRPHLMDWHPGGSNIWTFFPIYMIGPVAGAVVAAVFYDQVTEELKFFFLAPITSLQLLYLYSKKRQPHYNPGL